MKMQSNHYSQFLIMVGLHFIAMYILMYAMVNVFNNVFNSFNQIYMAALMTASMVLARKPQRTAGTGQGRVGVRRIAVDEGAGPHVAPCQPDVRQQAIDQTEQQRHDGERDYHVDRLQQNRIADGTPLDSTGQRRERIDSAGVNVL